ncbi:MAG: CBS domain-containing protein, partial [Anaerolineales bacterium]
LREAATLLTAHNIGAVVVVDEAGKLIGILSERDIVRAAARSETALTLTVGEIMTRNVIVGTPQDDVVFVVRLMIEKKFRHLPIVDGGQLAGILSIRDVAKAQLDEYAGTLDTLETQITEG